MALFAAVGEILKGGAMGILRALLCILTAAVAVPVGASFHTFQINEIYSNTDGSIQYVELKEGFGANGQQFLAGHSIAASQGASTHTFVFPADLPSAITANKSFLIATPGFAALGIVAPDYIMPAGFLFVGGGTVDYAGVDILTSGTLPTDGVTSLNRDGTTGVNSPRNFAGQTGSIPLAPIPPSGPASPIPLFDPRILAVLIVSLALSGALAFGRRG